MTQANQRKVVEPGHFVQFVELLKQGKRVTRNWWNDARYLVLIDGVLNIGDATYYGEYWTPTNDRIEPLNMNLFHFQEFGHFDWKPWEFDEEIKVVAGVDSTIHMDVGELFELFDDHFYIKDNKVYCR